MLFRSVAGEITGEIGPGLLVLLGVAQGDTEEDARWLAEKIAVLRIFEDEEEKMNRSVRDIGGAALVVSQFTLFASTRKGTRPSFNDAAKPDLAIPLYERFVQLISTAVGRPAATGRSRVRAMRRSRSRSSAWLIALAPPVVSPMPSSAAASSQSEIGRAHV